jgi:hypothetical protein
MLSKDPFCTNFGTTQLYQDYCPMYDEGKSGYWISETKEIKIHTLAPKCLLVDLYEKHFK